MFKTGDKVRVNAKLGKMRESKWIEGTILESDFEDDVLVETRFQKVWSPRRAVKMFKKLEYDSTNHVWPAVEEFKNKYWNDLKSSVSKALEEFFPNIKMVVDEEEKIINIVGKNRKFKKPFTYLLKIITIKDKKIILKKFNIFKLIFFLKE